MNDTPPELDWNRLLLHFVTTAAGLVGVAAAICVIGAEVFGYSTPGDFTLAPNAFFICSLFFVATGGLLGFAGLTDVRQLFRRRMLGALLCGAMTVGTECYGAWSLFPFRFLPKYPHVGTALIFVFLHILGCFSVLLLAGFVQAQAAVGPEKREESSLLTVCRIYWFVLGVVWTILLCSFALMLRAGR